MGKHLKGSMHSMAGSQGHHHLTSKGLSNFKLKCPCCWHGTAPSWDDYYARKVYCLILGSWAGALQAFMKSRKGHIPHPTKRFGLWIMLGHKSCSIPCLFPIYWHRSEPTPPWTNTQAYKKTSPGRSSVAFTVVFVAHFYPGMFHLC